jgi:hypothetical protein
MSLLPTAILSLLAASPAFAEPTTHTTAASCWTMSADEVLDRSESVEAAIDGAFQVLWPTHETRNKKSGPRKTDACIWIESRATESGRRAITTTASVTGDYVVTIPKLPDLATILARTSSVAIRVRLGDRTGTQRYVLKRTASQMTQGLCGPQLFQATFPSTELLVAENAIKPEKDLCVRVVDRDGRSLVGPSLVETDDAQKRFWNQALKHARSFYLEVGHPISRRARLFYAYNPNDPCSSMTSTASVGDAASTISLRVSPTALKPDPGVTIRPGHPVPKKPNACWSIVESPIGQFVSTSTLSQCREEASADDRWCLTASLTDVIDYQPASTNPLVAWIEYEVLRHLGLGAPGRYAGFVRIGDAPSRPFQLDITPNRSLIQSAFFAGILMSLVVGGFLALRKASFKLRSGSSSLVRQIAEARREMFSCGGLRFEIFDRAEAMSAFALRQAKPSVEDRFDNVIVLRQLLKIWPKFLPKTAVYVLPPILALTTATIILVTRQGKFEETVTIGLAYVGLFLGLLTFARLETTFAAAVWAVSAAVVNDAGDVGLNSFFFTIFVLFVARKNLLGGHGATELEQTLKDVSANVGIARKRAELQSYLCPGTISPKAQMDLTCELDRLDSDLASVGRRLTEAEAGRLSAWMDRLLVGGSRALSATPESSAAKKAVAKFTIEGELE